MTETATEPTLAEQSAALNHNPVTSALAEQVIAGINEINEFNKAIFGDENDESTPTKDIDKALKDDDVEKPDNIKKAYDKALKAQAAYKAAMTEARNLFRTEVLGETEKQDVEIDEDEKARLKENRSTVTQALNFIVTFATANNLKDVVQWAESIEVPRVGSKGSTSAGGTGVKRPRVFVTVDGTKYNSFSEAGVKDSSLKGLSDAWYAAGETSEPFDFNGKTVVVEQKVKKDADSE